MQLTKLYRFTTTILGKYMEKTETVINAGNSLDTTDVIVICRKINNALFNGPSNVVLDCTRLSRISLLGIAELTNMAMLSGLMRKVFIKAEDRKVVSLFEKFNWIKNTSIEKNEKI